MTHVVENFPRAPAHMVLLGKERAGTPRIELPIKAQGTIGFAASGATQFGVVFYGGEAEGRSFSWTVDAETVVLTESDSTGERELARFPGLGVHDSPAWKYWFSLDRENRMLMFGIGEMRLGTAKGRHALPARLPDPDKGPYSWIDGIETAEIFGAPDARVDIWRDPVTSEPPLYVVTHDEMTMEDVAYGEVTVPGNLTPRCRQLYDAVAGQSFLLDTPDFPDFSRAVAQSIATPGMWCYTKLRQKAAADEFGAGLDGTYLRITLGRNQGESPGIPYVMEIWPAGHFSPRHDHGGSDAVIRVLHGRIWVDLFPLLADDIRDPFATAIFSEGDVTWISRGLNQFHQLKNLGSEACITIQCYMYEESDDTHWPYFDFISGKGGAAQLFDPDSDCDFLEFKRIMRREWARNRR